MCVTHSYERFRLPTLVLARSDLTDAFYIPGVLSTEFRDLALLFGAHHVEVELALTTIMDTIAPRAEQAVLNHVNGACGGGDENGGYRTMCAANRLRALARRRIPSSTLASFAPAPARSTPGPRDVEQLLRDYHDKLDGLHVLGWIHPFKWCVPTMGGGGGADPDRSPLEFFRSTASSGRSCRCASDRRRTLRPWSASTSLQRPT